MEYTVNRIWAMAAIAAVAAAAAVAAGFPVFAAGVAAGLPVGIVNYVMTQRLRQQLDRDGGREIGTLIAQRTTLRMVLSVCALLLASRLGPDFLVGVLVGLVLEVFTYLKDAARLLSGRRE